MYPMISKMKCCDVHSSLWYSIMADEAIDASLCEQVSQIPFPHYHSKRMCLKHVFNIFTYMHGALQNSFLCTLGNSVPQACQPTHV